MISSPLTDELNLVAHRVGRANYTLAFIWVIFGLFLLLSLPSFLPRVETCLGVRRTIRRSGRTEGFSTREHYEDDVRGCLMTIHKERCSVCYVLADRPFRARVETHHPARTLRQYRAYLALAGASAQTSSVTLLLCGS